jgi:hypothetical protein
MNDNYPVLVTTASLMSLREQAAHLRGYLADDANAFGAEWLEEQQRRLDAVYSYIKSRQVRAEISHCQRWVELRIGEWLGPRRPGERTDLTCEPRSEVEIYGRHKREFRFLAENKEIVTAILQTYPGMEITRAELLAAIEDTVLVKHGAKTGSSQKVRGQYLCPCGETFDRPVWHCEVCAYHWPMEREECSQCHQGKRPEQKPLHDLAGIDPSLFKLATRAIGLADNFRKFVETARLEDVCAGLKDYEKSAFFANLRVIGNWIESAEQIKEKDRQDGRLEETSWPKTGQESPSD